MNIKYTISAEHNTNKIISSSEDKFLGMDKGTLIKIEGDPILHTIQNKDRFFFIKDFISDGSKIIIIKENTENNLQKGDLLKIVFSEYEASFLIDIKNKGNSYIIGEDIFVKNGILSIDIASGIGIPTSFEILETGINGSIEKLKIKQNGKYFNIPDSPVSVYSKRGEGCELEIKYMEISNRSFVERNIIDIHYSDGNTFIVLDYSLPINLKSGKISVEKSFILLSENYTGETKKNIKYEILKDFSPHLRLPLMIKNTLSPEVVYNKSCLIIDSEIQKIKDFLKIK